MSKQVKHVVQSCSGQQNTFKELQIRRRTLVSFPMLAGRLVSLFPASDRSTRSVSWVTVVGSSSRPVTPHHKSFSTGMSILANQTALRNDSLGDPGVQIM